MQPNGADRWARAPRVLWRLAPGQVLVRLVGGDGLDLTGLAALVWIAVDEPRRLDELVGELATVDSSVTAKSVTQMLMELEGLNLMQGVP